MLNSKPNKQKTTDSDLRINARKALDIKGIVALFFQPSMCLGEFRTPATHTTELFVTAVTVSGCYFFSQGAPSQMPQKPYILPRYVSAQWEYNKHKKVREVKKQLNSI